MMPSILKWDKRIIASKVPKVMPITMASAVSCKVNFMPVKNRYCHERSMTLKSNAPNMVGGS